MGESEPVLDQIEAILLQVRGGDISIDIALVKIEALIAKAIESAIADER